MEQHEDACSALNEFIKEEGQYILFAGAGVSAHAGLPVWDNYLAQLGEFARRHDPMTRHHMHEHLQEGSYLTAAELYFLSRKIPKAEKYQNLTTPLNDYDHKKLSSLVTIPFSSIVTTNYDRALLDAYADVHQRAAEEVNYGDPTLAAAPFNTRHYIARIHGRVEVPDSMLLSERHYENLHENPHYIDFLSHLFTRTRLLFVGFSFLDPAIRHVFDTVHAKVGKYHEGRHLALLPTDATDEFIQNLETFSVRKAFYSPDNNHEELWNCFERLDTSASTTSIPGTETQTADPFTLTKKYLGACYARSSLGHRVIPLRKAVVEGIVSSLITNAGEGGVTESAIKKIVAEELTLTEADASPLVDIAQTALINEGLITTSGSSPNRMLFPSTNNSDATYQSSLKVLEDGTINRYIVRSAGHDSPEIRRCLRSLFTYLVAKRGWDLGAAFAAGHAPDNMEIPSMLRSVPHCSTDNGVKEFTELSRSVENLLKHPNNAEAEVLAELGRASFALELITHTAHDTLFHALTLPERIYLDANVLMPAFAPGHPYHDVYQNTIKRLLEAAASALSNVEVIAYRGFLNEIVSHRRLAIEEMSSLDKENLAYLKKEALLYGTGNMNVYTGAYANTLIKEKELTFTEYLERHAPYKTEAELSTWFEDRGITVKGDAELKAGSESLPEIIHILEKAYADGKWHGKEGTLIMHDAVQLAALSRDLKDGKRVVFVSADRRLRCNVSGSRISSLANAMISHVGLTQLVDLLVGNPDGGRGLANMLWGSKLSGETEQIRNYLIDLALDQYSEGYAMEMGKIVDHFAEDAAFELSRQKLHPGTNDPAERAQVMKVLDAFEEKYFQTMREVIESKRSEGE